MNLDRTICPGCGTENPASDISSGFSCSVCDYDANGGLPTLREMVDGQTIRSDTAWDDVRLDLFLRTLLKP